MGLHNTTLFKLFQLHGQRGVMRLHLADGLNYFLPCLKSHFDSYISSIPQNYPHLFFRMCYMKNYHCSEVMKFFMNPLAPSCWLWSTFNRSSFTMSQSNLDFLRHFAKEIDVSAADLYATKICLIWDMHSKADCLHPPWISDKCLAGSLSNNSGLILLY